MCLLTPCRLAALAQLSPDLLSDSCSTLSETMTLREAAVVFTKATDVCAAALQQLLWLQVAELGTVHA